MIENHSSLAVMSLYKTKVNISLGYILLLKKKKEKKMMIIGGFVVVVVVVFVFVCLFVL